MPGFAASCFVLCHSVTGVSLYTTCATSEEIHHANANLAAKGFPYRYVPAPAPGTSSPVLPPC